MDRLNGFIAENATLIGDVRLGEKTSIWYGAVVRGDVQPIVIGDCTNIQDNCTVHVSTRDAVQIGSYVTVGHNAVVHGCTIGDNCIIGMGAIIMNRARIGKNCIIGAGAVVTEDTVVPDGSMVLGVPGRVKRALEPAEINGIRENALHYVALCEK